MKECVIIPIKEYEALKNRIKELENDESHSPEVKIEWGYSHERCGYFYSSQGKFILSDGLYTQVRRICTTINEGVEKAMDRREDILNEISKQNRESIEERALDRVSLLPWYKRLWFKPEYIK